MGSVLLRCKKPVIVTTGILLMYVGFIMLFWPSIITAWPPSLILTNIPQVFDFEDDFSSVSSTSGNPVIVEYPSASESKVVECQNGDYVRWYLATPSKTIDLTFKVRWTKFPTIANETLGFGQIWGLDEEDWQHLFTTTLFCNQYSTRGWFIRAGFPTSLYGSVSSEIVYALETNRWYSIRITADLNTGTYRLYMDRNELASIKDAIVADDVYIDFFRLGAGAIGNSIFTAHYDDVTVALLDPSPSSSQWSVRITSSPGGLTTPNGTVKMNQDESLTVDAVEPSGYVFSKWILDGVDYGTSLSVTLPPQPAGTQHTLHAELDHTGFEFNHWFPMQLIALVIIVGGGYLLWLQTKRNPTNGGRLQELGSLMRCYLS